MTEKHSEREAFEKVWAETYPNDVAYFAQYNDQGLMRDMCRLVAFDIFKASRAQPTGVDLISKQYKAIGEVNIPTREKMGLAALSNPAPQSELHAAAMNAYTLLNHSWRPAQDEREKVLWALKAALDGNSAPRDVNEMQLMHELMNSPPPDFTYHIVWSGKQVGLIGWNEEPSAEDFAELEKYYTARFGEGTKLVRIGQQATGGGEK